MELEIYTYDKSLLYDILGRASDSRSVTIPGNATLTYKVSTMRLADGLPEIINFAMTFGSGIATGLISNWIYDKLTRRTEKILINRKEVYLDKEEIKRILEETIKIER